MSVATHNAPRWVEVLSHLHPRYGGLSSAVPALAASLGADQADTPLRTELAAFCAPGEEFIPEGFTVGDNLRFWPASRKVWLRDRMRGKLLQSSLDEPLRGAAGVHLHGLWETSTAVGASAARRLGIPYVVSAHGMLEPWALRQKRWRKQVYAAMQERPVLRRARVLHALTLAEAQQFAAFGARVPVAVIPNAVAIPFEVSATAFLAAFPALRGTRMILFCGRLHPKKGLDLLLEAWAPLAAHYPDVRLVLAGPDTDGTQTRLQQLATTLGVLEQVIFPGMLAGELKWSALAAAEAAVLPSRSEGLSMSVLEALGMGKPVLITKACNMPEVREHGAGWVVEPEVEPLREALAELLRNSPEENARLGEHGAKLVAAHYAPPVVARQMAELYLWVAGGPQPNAVELHHLSSTGTIRSFARAPVPAVKEVC